MALRYKKKVDADLQYQMKLFLQLSRGFPLQKNTPPYEALLTLHY